MSQWLHAVYPTALIVSISGLTYIDYSWKLAFWHDARRTITTLLIMITYFSLWDICGIGMSIFYAGADTYRSGLMLGPSYPIEELLFLTLLSYTLLLCWVYGSRVK